MISGCEASGKKLTGLKKGRFPEIDDTVFASIHERHKTGLFVSYDLFREDKKARSLKILRGRFKASKVWGHKVLAPGGAGVAF